MRVDQKPYHRDSNQCLFHELGISGEVYENREFCAVNGKLELVLITCFIFFTLAPLLLYTTSIRTRNSLEEIGLSTENGAA